MKRGRVVTVAANHASSFVAETPLRALLRAILVAEAACPLQPMHTAV
jgi:hypothetical protein